MLTKIIAMSQEIRLYMLQTGVLKTKLHNIKMNQGLNEDYDIPVPWYLITHPKGNIVIDGGNAVECAENPRAHWGDIVEVYDPVMKKEEGCVEALHQLGIDPKSIRLVLQSHLHLDHTGAIGRFPNATHVVQRHEYEYAFAPDWFAKGGYIRKDFDKPGLKWSFLKGDLTDFYDVYGDGVVKMVHTPGHSPGHTSFLINLPHTGNVLLAVDAAYTKDHWEDKALPGFLASTVDAVRSVEKLRTVAERTEALVVTGHDPEAWPSFRKAPEYYD